MTTTAKFMLAAAILLVAIWQWPGHIGRNLDKPAAEARAGAMLQTWLAHSGEQSAHFGKPVAVDYPDGWEFSWIYLPCPATARLRIFIYRDGRANYGESPDCHPVRGFGMAPQKV